MESGDTATGESVVAAGDGVTPAGLRARRRALGLSQRALAEAIGVSGNTIARWERGELTIGSPVLLGYALEHLERGGPLPVVSPAGRAPALRPLPPADNLPAAATPLIGREGELAAVVQRLREGAVRLLTLTGPGGSGKTRLALAVGEALRGSFAGGLFFVDLSPTREPAAVVSAVAASLGVHDAGQRPLFESLRRFLQQREVLLLLDNFEQVVEAAPLVGELLGSCPGLKALVTSREALRLGWERVFAVPPLALPALDRLPGLAALAEVPAVALFVARTQAQRPEFALAEGNVAAVAALCAGLEGLPLAIELAAARGRLMSPEAMLARLRPRLALLQGGGRDLPARQRSLRAAIGWSYELLPAAERALFRRLGAFVGGWTLEGAAAVAELASGACLDGLGALLEKSLVQRVDQGDGEPRFGMLETIREYALEQLAESGEREGTLGRHAAYCLALAEGTERELHGPGLAAALDRLEAEHDNLRAALRLSLDNGDGETAVRLGAALWQFWWIRGYLAEGRRWLEAALALGSDRSTARAKALNGAGLLSALRGDVDEPAGLFAESAAICREIGDGENLSHALCHRGATAGLMQGDGALGMACVEESLALARGRGYGWLAGYALWYLGMFARAVGDTMRAAALFGESLALQQEQGEPRAMAYALLGLGEAARVDGDGERAAALCQEALACFREVREMYGIVWSLSALGQVAWPRGERERAVRVYGATAALAEAVGQILTPGVPGEYEAAVAVAREALGPAAFEAAFAEGQAMPLAVALDYAARVGEPAAVSAASPADGPSPLTAREREVAALVARGLTNRAIAAALVVSERTVEAHVAHICQKLGVRSRAQVAAWAATG